MEEMGQIEWKVIDDCKFHFRGWGDGDEMKLRLASDWLVKTKGPMSVYVVSRTRTPCL